VSLDSLEQWSINVDVCQENVRYVSIINVLSWIVCVIWVS